MRVGPVPVVVVLLAAAATAAGFSTVDLHRAEREVPEVVVVRTSPPPAPAPEPAADPAAAGDGWSGLGDVVLGLVLLVALAVAGWGGWLLLRRLRRPGTRSWYRLRALRPTTAAPEHTVDGEQLLAAFVEAYWLARYATHTVDEHMRTQARSALQRLRAELRAEVGVS